MPAALQQWYVHQRYVPYQAAAYAHHTTHAPVSQAPRGWLNRLISRNIERTFTTLLVCQALIAWLKLRAARNMAAIVVTALVCQEATPWLNWSAYWNIASMVVTP